MLLRLDRQDQERGTDEDQSKRVHLSLAESAPPNSSPPPASPLAQAGGQDSVSTVTRRSCGNAAPRSNALLRM
jgi:hypothetical protein